MGRYTTGATTTSQVCRIELSYLMKNGYIQKGKHLSGQISWTNDSNVGFASYFDGESGYLHLKYTITSYNDEKTQHDYKVQLITIPSNLGVGRIVYFVCPQSGMNCKVLYRCYGSHIWKHREAYQHRIYYDSQICSKSYRLCERFFSLEKQFEKLKPPVKRHYKGKVTHAAIRYQRTHGLMNMYDRMRWEQLDTMMDKYRYRF